MMEVSPAQKLKPAHLQQREVETLNLYKFKMLHQLGLLAIERKSELMASFLPQTKNYPKVT